MNIFKFNSLKLNLFTSNKLNLYGRFINKRFMSSSSSLDFEINDKINDKLNSDIPNPLKHKDFFGVSKLFTVKELFQARVHLGHKKGTLNPHMTPYLFGSRLDMLIFDLDQTAVLLREALNFIAHIAFRSGAILFVTRQRQTGHLVEKTAKECGEYSHCRYWNPATFTDSEAAFNSVIRLPDLVIFLSTLNNVFETHPAVIDSSKLLIPSVGIVDTNSDPTLITYPIPGNDDTPCAVELYCRIFKQAILLGKEKREEFIKKYGTVPM